MALFSKKFKWVGVVVLGILVSGCGDTREMLGLEKSAPDEFAVYSRAPLSLPPDFALKPPRPGADRPQEETEREKAQRALFSRSRQPVQQQMASQATPGLRSLLEQTGALNSNPSIRNQVDRETGAFIAETESFTQDMMFWKDEKAFGTKIDAAKEAERIRDAQALGEAVDGADAVVIERKEEAIFEGLFN